MGIISTLRQSNIRFNPRPWLNEETPTEEVQFQSVESATTMVKDNSFVDLHMKVAEKVDALIAEMEEDGRFDNWGQTGKNLEGTVLRN